MPAEVTEVGPCKRRIAITISPETVQKAFADMWRQARNNVQMKGFRPGKIPKAVLERKYGDYVRQEVKQNLVNDAYREALKAHDLHPIAAPDVDLEKLEIEPGKGVEFELSVEIRPTFELGEYKGIAVGAPPVKVQDADVERELERFRAGRASIEPIEEDAGDRAADHHRRARRHADQAETEFAVSQIVRKVAERGCPDPGPIHRKEQRRPEAAIKGQAKRAPAIDLIAWRVCLTDRGRLRFGFDWFGRVGRGHVPLPADRRMAALSWHNFIEPARQPS